jgi:pimeloyl-[acyl-carrier protein] methyl ester esterase
MSEIELITYHGWGGDDSFWSGLQKNVPDKIHWKNFDRGYFDKPTSPGFTEKNGTKIVLTHSFGLHLCPNEILDRADTLIIYSGFLHFHPQAAQFRRRSKQVVAEMISKFKERPYDVLKAFYRNVFHPEKEFDLPPKTINNELLLEDLKLLNKNKQALPSLKKNAKVFIFHGADDAIVPKRKGRALYQKFGRKAQYFEIKQSGHGLPLTQPDRCWRMIESEIT